MIPSIVTFLQKMWRGYLARQLFKQMLAVHRILGVYRKYKLRSYVQQIQGVLGFPKTSNRNSTSPGRNFKGRNSKAPVALPSCGLNVKWPEAPGISLNSVISGELNKLIMLINKF